MAKALASCLEHGYRLFALVARVVCEMGPVSLSGWPRPDGRSVEPAGNEPRLHHTAFAGSAAGGQLFLLVGASIAFYHQHPEYLTMRDRDASLSNRLKERLALSVMYLIAQSHFRGTSPWTMEGLAQYLAVPTDVLTSIIAPLEPRGLVIAAGEDPLVYVPAHAPESIAVKTLLDTVRSGEEGPDLSTQQPRREQAVDRIISRVDQAVDAALAGITLRELCVGAPPQVAPAVTHN